MVTDGQAALRGLGAALLWISTCRYLHHSDQLVRAGCTFPPIPIHRPALSPPIDSTPVFS